MKDLKKKEVNWVRIGRNLLAYVLGIGIGSVLVWALWLRNRDIPSFWPEGRVKDQIKASTIETNDLNNCYLSCYETTDSLFRSLIVSGDVKFPPARRKPYPVYGISTVTSSGEKTRWWIESKDSTYNILKVEDMPGTTKNHFCKCNPASF